MMMRMLLARQPCCALLMLHKALPAHTARLAPHTAPPTHQRTYSKMPTDPQDLQNGDEVSWKWGAGHPKGEVKDVVEDK